MKKIEILLYGKNPDILQTVLRLINANDQWTGEGTAEEQKVIAKSLTKSYDIVLLGGGISKSSERRVRSAMGQLSPSPKVIQHFGGGSGLLLSEIEAALTGNESVIFDIVE